MNRIVICMATCVGFVSCTNNFDEYNKNPNESALWDISAGAMMEDIIFGGTNDIASRTWYLVNELMQFTVTGKSDSEHHQYVINNNIVSSAWVSAFLYANNADHMYRLACKADPENIDPLQKNYKAIALTMKSLYMSNATDMFGDIPCSEAFKGREGLYKPVFDSQEDVYRSMLIDLEAANEYYVLNRALARPEKDLLYKGDIKKWQKFTNSLHLRLLMRLSNRDKEMNVSAKIREIFENPAKYPVFTSNDDNATVFFAGTAPFINNLGNQNDVAFSRNAAANIIDLFLGSSDPRLPYYFRKDGNWDWKGQISGTPSQDADREGISKLKGDNLGRFNSPFSLMKCDEVLFIYAEAAKRGMIDGGETVAEQYYKEAITSSIKYWSMLDNPALPITDAKINLFLGGTAFYNGTLEKIMVQKYISQFWVGYEAWNDYRRTGFPKLKIGNGTAVNNYTLPTRLSYPLNTRSTNPINYANAVERMKVLYNGGDNMLTPVWWSKQASEMNY